MANILTPRAASRQRIWSLPVSALADPRVVVGLITLGGAVVRLMELGAKPLWFDEATLWLTARPHDLSTVLHANAYANSAPPLFVFLIHGVVSLSSSEAALRLAPALAATIAVPVMYYLSMTFWPNRLAGYLTAALFALAPQQVYYAQQVREYSIAVLLTALLFLVGWQVNTSPSRARLVLLAMLEGVAVLTQYGLVLVLMVLIPFVAFTLWRSRALRPLALLVGLQAVPGVATIGVFLTTLRYQMQTGGFGSTGYLSDGYWQHHSVKSLAALALGHTYHLVGFALTYGSIPILVGLLLGTAGVAAACQLSRGRELLILLLGPFAVTFVLALVHLYPYVAARQDIYLTVPLSLLVGWGAAAVLAWRPKSRSTVGDVPRPLIPGFVALILLGGLAIPLGKGLHDYLRSAGDEVVTSPLATLQLERFPRDGVYVANDAIPAYLYYTCRTDACPPALQADGEARVVGHRLPALVVGHVTLGDAPGTVADQRYRPGQIRRVLQHWPRVWLLFSHTDAAARSHVLAIARAEGSVVARSLAPDASLYLYTPR